MTLWHWLTGAHAHDCRERDDSGILWLVCACGHRVQALARTPQEREQMAATYKPVPRLQATPQTPSGRVTMFQRKAR